MSNTRFLSEASVSEIKEVTVKVLQFKYNKPNPRADNDWDYNGGYDVEFICLYNGEDITVDLSENDYERIESEIIDYFKDIGE
jgi:hypothetical protein